MIQTLKKSTKSVLRHSGTLSWPMSVHIMQDVTGSLASSSLHAAGLHGNSFTWRVFIYLPNCLHSK